MFIRVSKDGLSVSSSHNCEDSSDFLVEGTSAITLEIMSVKTFFSVNISAHVSSINPWANSRCLINKSECALCCSYVNINSFFYRWKSSLRGVASTGIQANDPSALDAPNGKSMSILLLIYSSQKKSLECHVQED